MGQNLSIKKLFTFFTQTRKAGPPWSLQKLKKQKKGQNLTSKTPKFGPEPNLTTDICLYSCEVLIWPNFAKPTFLRQSVCQKKL